MSNTNRYDEFVHLLRLNTNRILGYLDTLLLNRHDAEDLFQETSIVLWQKFDEFKSGTNFLAWALRIADHKVMNFYTVQSRRSAFTAGLRDALISEISSRKADCDDSLETLASCMKRLADGDRRMITLCYAENVPVPQVANLLGRSPESVYHSLRRIRNWLIECVQRESRRAQSQASIEPGILAKEDAR